MIRRRPFCIALILSLLSVTVPHGASAREAPPALRIDPLLVAQATDVWSIIAQPDNAIWPGWNAASTPLLFYLPGVQDVLINHPKPPEGFRRYDGPVRFPGGVTYVRDGRTFFEFDGQNTVVDVAGTPTLVVADTLSNRRNQLRGWLEDPRPTATKSAELGWDQLLGSPYDSLAMIAHEAFHAFQKKQAPQKGGNEEALARYPAIVAANTLGLALEGDLLAAAMRADAKSEVRALAVQWLAVRQERRQQMSAEAIAYEDHVEYLEGLAKYVEYRLYQVLEGRQAGAAMSWVQGFRGYADLQPQRDNLIRQMAKMMRGEANVNNDPYGASPVRMRHYFSGMAIAVILDRLGVDWKSRIFQPDVTLTSLASTALNATEAELAEARAAVRNRDGYAALAKQKEQLERDGAAATRKLVEAVESGPQTTLVVDYAALGDARPTMAFTPFGILRVDDNRTLYRLIPISFKLGATTARQTIPTPLLHDRAAKRFTLQLQEALPAERLQALLGMKGPQASSVELKGIELPGVKLDGGRAAVTIKDRQVELRLLAEEKQAPR